MVVDNLNVLGSTVAPDKANAPLVVDANRVLAISIARQLLQMVAGWRSKVAELDRILDSAKTAFGSRYKIDRKAPRRLAIGDLRNGLASEGPDHRFVSDHDTHR